MRLIWRLLGVLLIVGSWVSAAEAQDALGWTVDSDPLIVIGDSPTNESEQLYLVAGAVRLNDGRLVIANAGTDELRVFTAQGEWLRTVGGEGDGPGEFQRIVRVGSFGADSIYVFDRNAQRLSVYSPDGDFVWDERVLPSQDAGFVHDLIRLANGTWVSVEGEFSQGPRPGERRRNSFEIFSRGDGLEAPVQVGEVPDEVMVGASIDGRSAFRQALFSPRALYEPYGTCVLTSPGDRADLHLFNMGRASPLEWELTIPSEPVTEAHVDQYVAWQVAEVEASENEEAMLRQQLASLPQLPTMPLFASIAVDALGYVWLEEYEPPYQGRSSWLVINSTGMPVGKVRTPRNLEIFQIGEDWILAGWEGQYDEEHVGLFELDRQGSESQSMPPTCD